MIQGETGMPFQTVPNGRGPGAHVTGARAPVSPLVSTHPHDHLVQFHEDPSRLLESVSAWLRAG
ncbi:MAG TPA: hypothetical protein VK465_05180, partial [Fibrobacteria bacterium]|nr:hypothetical protein [Fibrobacteria bacterium]